MIHNHVISIYCQVSLVGLVGGLNFDLPLKICNLIFLAELSLFFYCATLARFCVKGDSDFSEMNFAPNLTVLLQLVTANYFPLNFQTYNLFKFFTLRRNPVVMGVSKGTVTAVFFNFWRD